jgi:hypothetical protein
MGIEPTRSTLPGLENKAFRAAPNPKCDQRVNFSGVGLHRDTSVREVPGS